MKAGGPGFGSPDGGGSGAAIGAVIGTASSGVVVGAPSSDEGRDSMTSVCGGSRGFSMRGVGAGAGGGSWLGAGAARRVARTA